MPKKPKKYILDMFPYPSGDGLHVGHVLSYTATDILSRYYKMKDYEVLHPQGWDAFGLPAENFAIKTGIHPSITTKKAISKFKKQMKLLGFDYDWQKEINSSDPKYYKWTQWMFLQFYKNGLAYRKKAKVNWCPKCKTVLANEQAEGGKCERCESEVIQKELEQWFFKITDFIEDQYYKGKKIKGLLSGLDGVDWPESTKEAQKNWIGKSEGAIIKFEIKNSKSEKKEIVEVFTTRPDTLFGCTYFVLAPEHPLLKRQKSEIKNKKEIEEYIKKTKRKTELERANLLKEKTGVKIEGLFAINPANKQKIPIFIADYVMMEYGTGAIMAVPAHDERDWEFAHKYNLKIQSVILPRNKNDLVVKIETSDTGENKLAGDMLIYWPEKETIKEAFQRFVKEIKENKRCYTGKGKLINSQKFNDIDNEKAKWEITKEVKGKRAVNYKLRDWLISRQRYWGAPIPIVYDPQGNPHPIPEKYLPWKLPTDVKFEPKGYSPLSRSKELLKRTEKIFGKGWQPEVDTMDTFVCSSWYFLRYADPKNEKKFASKNALKKWLPVDIYVGGAEHSVLHLLYARFFTKALQKYGYLDFNEPFLKLRHQGIILAPNGQKMSKSKGNVINPDDVVKEYGADTLRMYEMFLGPLEDTKPWDTKGITGIKKFLERIEKVTEKAIEKKIIGENKKSKLIQKTIKKITEDIESFKFNTAISQLMIQFNSTDWRPKINTKGFFQNAGSGLTMDKDTLEKFLILLSPFAPFISEKLWKKLGNKESIFKQPWPNYDKKLIEDEKITLIIQVNGKLRDKIEINKDLSQKEIESLTLEREKIKKYVAGKKLKKIIFVPNKLINIVT